jgi:integrase
MTTSRNQLAAPIKALRAGLAIYKVNLSPYWRVRIWVPSLGKYQVRSTKETSRIEAAKAAEELAADLQGRGTLDAVPRSRTFEYFADRHLMEQQKLADQGQRHRGIQINDRSTIRNEGWGLIAYFGRRDVATIKTKDILGYIAWSQRDREKPLAWSTINNRISCLRKILKLAHHDGLISEIPSTPKPPRKDNPRPYFKFEPLVGKKRDEYQALLRSARELAEERHLVRGIAVTGELYDFILFMAHSFLRPTESEVYALRHSDVTVATNPKRLILTVRKGKTGYRQINTLEACASVYRRLATRKHKSDDYLFLPSYKNRSTAKRIIQRQFNAALKRVEETFGTLGPVKHSPYSLRHTAICMRIVKSEGKVNIFNLAKTAGTSVEQIERFYARHLPLGPEMARNLQSFGGIR